MCNVWDVWKVKVKEMSDKYKKWEKCENGAMCENWKWRKCETRKEMWNECVKSIKSVKCVNSVKSASERNGKGKRKAKGMCEKWKWKKFERRKEKWRKCVRSIKSVKCVPSV